MDNNTLRDLFVSENFDRPSEAAFQSFETKMYSGQVTWRVQQSDLKVQKYGDYKECVFSIGNPDFCKVKLRIFPSGHTAETNDYLCFSVSFKENLPKHSYCCCTVSIVDKNGIAIKDGDILNKKTETNSGRDDRIINFECFTPKDLVKNYLVREVLIIRCSVEISLNTYFSVSDETQVSWKDHNKVDPPSERNINQIITDVELQIENEKIKVNKALLMSEVPVFNIAFRPVPEDILYKPDWDIKAQTFKTILNYIYTKSIDINTFSDACEIYSAACQLQLSNLMDICVAYLVGNMSTNNMHNVKLLADKHEDEALNTAYLHFFNNKELAKLSI